jgi:beta-galactosidase
LLAQLACEAGLAAHALPEGLRTRRRADHAFAFNFGPHSQAVPAPRDAEFVIGQRQIAPAELAIWRSPRDGGSAA